jgi:hypothetical protein
MHLETYELDSITLQSCYTEYPVVCHRQFVAAKTHEIGSCECAS